MAILGTLGKLFSGFGDVTDFLPNMALKALHLPPLTNPFKMGGDLLQGKGLKNLGTEWGNNAKLGALAAGAYFGGPAIAHAFGIGGGAGAGAGAGAASGNPIAAVSEGLPSGTAAAGGVTAPPVGWSGWHPAVHAAGMGNLTQGMGGMSSMANSVAGGGGGYGGSTFAAAPPGNTVGGGTIGPGGNAVGSGGPGAAEPAKSMNPILKSFLDNYMKQRGEASKGQPQQFTPPPMPGGRPGREYFPSLGGY